jgi:hypothetical protein
MARHPRSGAGEQGQASVELVALLPIVALLVALLWQALLAGEAVWLGAGAARAAARASALGDDPLRAARSVLPSRFAAVARVRTTQDGAVDVSVPVPLLLGRGVLTDVHARARFEAQR